MSVLRDQVIREMTVAPGWNKEDATALLDALLAEAAPPPLDGLRAVIAAVPQRQSNTTDGDCLAAAISTITGLDVPNFIESPKWHTLYRDWLRERGWAFTDDDGSRPMLGFSVAVGGSPTFPFANHATVALDGIVVWDPSPNRDEPGRSFTPRQFWPVFRLASGRPVYDPWASEASMFEYRNRMAALFGGAAIRASLRDEGETP